MSMDTGRSFGDMPLYASTLVMRLQNDWLPTLKTVLRKIHSAAIGVEVSAPTQLASIDGLLVFAAVRTAAATWAASDAVTLPSEFRDLDIVIVKDVDGSGAAKNIAVLGADAETIDGGLSVAITTNYGSLKLVAWGGAWYTF